MGDLSRPEPVWKISIPGHVLITAAVILRKSCRSLARLPRPSSTNPSTTCRHDLLAHSGTSSTVCPRERRVRISRAIHCDHVLLLLFDTFENRWSSFFMPFSTDLNGTADPCISVGAVRAFAFVAPLVSVGVNSSYFPQHPRAIEFSSRPLGTHFPTRNQIHSAFVDRATPVNQGDPTEIHGSLLTRRGILNRNSLSVGYPARVTPVKIGSCDRCAKSVSGLRNRHSGKVPHFHRRGFLRLLTGKGVESFVERQDFLVLGGEGGTRQFDARPLQAIAVLDTVSLPGFWMLVRCPLDTFRAVAWCSTPLCSLPMKTPSAGTALSRLESPSFNLLRAADELEKRGRSSPKEALERDMAAPRKNHEGFPEMGSLVTPQLFAIHHTIDSYFVLREEHGNVRPMRCKKRPLMSASRTTRTSELLNTSRNQTMPRRNELLAGLL